MSYFFRKTNTDFRKWCSTYIDKAKRYVKQYESNTNTFDLIFKKKEYDASIDIINQYTVLKSSLNIKEKEALELLIKGKDFNILEYKFEYREIYNNWLEICFPKSKSIIKELDKKKFGMNLRKYRIMKSMSINKVSDLIGVDKSTINKYELGYQFPRVDVLYKLLQIYEITFEDITR